MSFRKLIGPYCAYLITRSTDRRRSNSTYDEDKDFISGITRFTIGDISC